MGVDIGHDWLITKAGLRAQLGIESYVTGQLLVELEFRPDTDVVLRGVNAAYPEIPTITSNLQQLLDNIERWMSDVQSDLDIGEISQRLVSALEGIDEIAHSSDLRDSLAALNALLSDEVTQELAMSIDAALADLRNTLGEAGALFQSADRNLDDLMEEMQPALQSLNAALIEAERTLGAASAQLDGDSPQIYQLQSTLRELEGAAIAIREFFDYLERNPESLIRGKKQ